MVIGHHPHVVQGVESYKNASVAYSLGNFLANPVYWENGDRLTWNDFERTSFVLLAELDKQGLLSLQQIPIFDDGKMIDIDTAGHGQRTLNRANKALERGATPARYRYEAFRVRTLLPLRAQLRWGKLRSLRPQDIGKVARLFKRGIS
jgi:poly-gamma-glutamate synthesis protein (capsule biosynthesis protein)